MHYLLVGERTKSWRAVIRVYELALVAILFTACPVTRGQATLPHASGSTSTGDPILHPSRTAGASVSGQSPATSIGTPDAATPGSNGPDPTTALQTTTTSARTSLPTALSTTTTSTSAVDMTTTATSINVKTTNPLTAISSSRFTTSSMSSSPLTTLASTSLTSPTASAHSVFPQTASSATPPTMTSTYVTMSASQTAQTYPTSSNAAPLASSSMPVHHTAQVGSTQTTPTTLPTSSPRLKGASSGTLLLSAASSKIISIITSSTAGTPRIRTSHRRPTTATAALTTSQPANHKEATLLALLTVICSVTGVGILLMLIYLIYRQNRTWQKAKAASRSVGAVNKMFFNADVEMQVSGPREMMESQDTGTNEVSLTGHGLTVRHAESNVSDAATSEYSSSSESLERLEQHELMSTEEAIVQANGTSTVASRKRTMTGDSGCEQGTDPWESGAPTVHANPTQPITTQLVYTNINSESDLDLDVDRALPQTNPIVQFVPPTPITEQAQVHSGSPSHANVSGARQLSSNHGTFDCHPVMNAEGVVVRTARFPSKTSSQFSHGSGSGNSADHLTG